MTEERTTSVTTWTRLEPRSRSNDLTPVLEARVHDPLWQLGLQWRLGELVGEDAGSPVWAELEVSSAPLDAFAASGTSAALPPGIPLDCILGAEAGETTTAADRAEAGAELLDLLSEHGGSAAAHLALVSRKPLNTPVEIAAGVEGASYLALVANRLPDAVTLEPQLREIATSGVVPTDWKVSDGQDTEAVVAAARDWVTWRNRLLYRGNPKASTWEPSHLEHAFSLGVNRGKELPLCLMSGEWHGDRLDWHDVDVAPDKEPPRPPTSTPLVPTTLKSAGLPTALTYPGMPSSRFFEFEDAAVSLAQVDVATNDLARLLVIEFACVYGNDWYLWPADLPVGALHTITKLKVRTTFDEVKVKAVPAAPADGAAPDWQMFRPANGNGAAVAYDGLLILPTLVGPLTSEPVEQVRFLRDETANLAWAVETTVEGADGEPFDRHTALAVAGGLPESPPTPTGDDTDPLHYRLTTEVPYHWYPLAPDLSGDPRRGNQLRRLTVERVHPDGTPMVIDPSGATLASVRWVWQEEVPREGAIVVRRDVLARSTDGMPRVWRARRKSTGLGEGTSGLRYDEAMPEPREGS